MHILYVKLGFFLKRLVLERSRRWVASGVLAAPPAPADSSRVLLDALSLSRETETAYKVAVQDTYPGHGHFVRQNATTLWERWEATAHDPTGGSSMHHTGLRREALFGPGQSAVYGGACGGAGSFADRWSIPWLFVLFSC